MKNFRPFDNKSELITEYANHSPIRDKEDLVFVLREKCNSLIRTFRLKGDREFPYDIEDGVLGLYVGVYGLLEVELDV